MGFVGKLDDLYLGAPGHGRRNLNQFMFERLLISDGGVVGAIYKEPWASVLTEDFAKRAKRSAAGDDGAFPGASSKIEYLVPPGRVGRKGCTWLLQLSSTYDVP